MIKAAPLLYTDEEVTSAAGLPLDSLRRLITWGAVRPAQSGGGRGRVRLWTTRQALRISATAQFAATGLSLQMAHTLTYCIPPLDSLVTIYDPESLVQIYAHKKQAQLDLPEDPIPLDVLTKPGELVEWPIPGEFLGSETLIVDGRYFYTDAWGDAPLLVAEIDADRQRVIPYYDPTRVSRFLFGDLGQFVTPDVHTIDKSSLLIDRKYLSSRGKAKLLSRRSVSGQITGRVVCKSLLSINLAFGFILCVRKLRGIPIEYKHPIEFLPADDEP